MPADVLAPVWAAHRKWSRVADDTRTQLDTWRKRDLWLLVAGALLAALAAQTWLPRPVAAVLALAGTAVLAAATWIQRTKLTKDTVRRWTVARAASETLKAATYWYLAGVAPFTGPQRDAELDAVLARVDESGDEFSTAYTLATADGKPCPDFTGVAAYTTQRAVEQRDWHEGKVATNEHNAARLRNAETWATVLAAVLGAVAGGLAALSGQHLTGVLGTLVAENTDVSAGVGLLTTLGATIAAHLLAKKYENLATAYGRTSMQLTRLIDRRAAHPATTESEAAFVRSVEDVLNSQNEGWVALVTQ